MGIEISVVAGPDRGSCAATASGSVQNVINDQEARNFGLNTDQLKEAVNRYFGARPDDAWLHEPATNGDWQDLYSRYGWEQVSVVLVADSATILSLTSEPTIVSEQAFRNNSSVVGTFNCGISQSVTNTVANTWSQTDSIQVGQKITYKVGIEKVAEIGGETSFSYTHTWGESKTESSSMTIGQTSGVTVQLQPGQAVLSQLTASRGTLKVRVSYHAFLTGLTAINYGNPYKGHHFWALPIADVMRGAGLSNLTTYTEDLDVGFYANASVEIQDAQTHQLVALPAAGFKAAG